MYRLAFYSATAGKWKRKQLQRVGLGEICIIRDKVVDRVLPHAKIEQVVRKLAHGTSSVKGDHMLVLSRKIGERIVINGNIIVAILEKQGNKIRVGIEAPPEVEILREELLDRELREEHEVGSRATADRR